MTKPLEKDRGIIICNTFIKLMSHVYIYIWHLAFIDMRWRSYKYGLHLIRRG